MKRALRQTLRKRMAGLSKDQIHLQSENILQVLRTLPEYQQSTKVACFLHMEYGEVETGAILQDAFDHNKQVFLPRIVPAELGTRSREIDMLKTESMDQVATFEPQGKYNLREPPASAASCFDLGGLDLIVLPGMGFTKQCERIGHGGGFYDNFLNRHESWSKTHNLPRPFLVAIGAAEQLVESIPIEPHDRPLDAVIINDQLYRIN